MTKIYSAKDPFHRAKTCEITEADILSGDELNNTALYQFLPRGHGAPFIAKMIKHRRAIEQFGQPTIA